MIVIPSQEWNWSGVQEKEVTVLDIIIVNILAVIVEVIVIDD